MKAGEVYPDYIVFGHFYGECIGEQCVEIFKLTETDLSEDITDHYPNISGPYIGNFQVLDHALFEAVTVVRPAIPRELLATDAKVIGIPDGGDWGGIYLEISVDGEIQYWLIDKMRSNLPGYIIPLVDQIEKDIELINK